MFEGESFERIYDRLKAYREGNYIDFTKYTLGKAIDAVSNQEQAARIKAFIRDYMPETLPEPVLALDGKKILVVGECCVRALTALEETMPEAALFGVETDPEYLDWAKKFYDASLWDVADLSFDAPLYQFDVIFFASPFKRKYVLYNTLLNINQHLVPDGGIVARFNNASDAVWINALREGRWPYGTMADYFTADEISRRFTDDGYDQIAMAVSDGGAGWIYAREKFKRESSDDDCKPVCDRVLMLLEQYPNGNRERAADRFADIVLNSIHASGLVERADVFNYESLRDMGVLRYLEVVRRYVGRFTPSVIFCFVNSFHYFSGFMEGLNVLGAESGTPVVALEGDFVTMRSMPIYQEQKSHYYNNASRVLTVDLPNAAQYSKDSKFIGVCFNPCPTPFDSEGYEKDIDVSFIGRIRYLSVDKQKSIRERMLEHLSPFLDQGGVHYMFMDTRVRLPEYTLDYYIDICRRSKMIINFGESSSGLMHVTGRVFEAIASNALLFELENPTIRGLFEPGTHFVEFSTPEELLEKILYYNEHETERKRIAAAARDRYLTLYNEYNLWRFAFERCGFEAAHPATVHHYDVFQGIMEKAERMLPERRWNEDKLV